MVSNGQATNGDDTDNNKDITFRVNAEITPEVSAGTFTQASNFSYGERARHGLNFKYQSETVLIRAEGILQSQNQNSVRSHGIMVDGGYRFGNWQPSARYEVYNPDTSGSQTGSAASLGLNYYFAQKTKAMFGTTVFWDLNASNGTLAFASSAKGNTGTLMNVALSAAL